MVIFISDHGHYVGYPNDGGQVGKHLGYQKSDGKMAGAEADVFVPLLDSVSNPPFLVRMPGQTKGAVRPELAQPADVMPTILESLGIRIPDTVQGQSMAPLLKGSKIAWRSHAVTAAYKQFAQITDPRWLYGAWIHNHPPKLFDRKTDPQQKRDVLKQHRDIARRLHKKLIAEMTRLGAPAEWIGKIDAKARLARL